MRDGVSKVRRQIEAINYQEFFMSAERVIKAIKKGEDTGKGNLLEAIDVFLNIRQLNLEPKGVGVFNAINRFTKEDLETTAEETQAIITTEHLGQRPLRLVTQEQRGKYDQARQVANEVTTRAYKRIEQSLKLIRTGEETPEALDDAEKLFSYASHYFSSKF